MIVESDIQQWKVIAECAEAHTAMASSTLGVFVRLADAVTPLRAGCQVRFSWSLLRLVDDASRLRVVEPDFVRWPDPRWALTIDTTLRIAPWLLPARREVAKAPKARLAAR